MLCLRKLFTIGVLLGVCVLYPLSAQAQTEYTLGVVPQFDSRKIAKIWQPIIREIEKQSGIRLRLVGAPSIPDFEKAFTKGEYDFAYMNPYHALVANQSQGYQPIIRDVGRQLFGIIVVRKDSSINSVKELDKMTVAFPAPNALGASLIPRSEFSTKYNIKIKPKYVKSHGSVYLNVLLGQAQAGGGVQKTFERQSEEIKSQLRILYKTRKVAPHPVVAHPRVKKEAADKFAKAILSMEKTIKHSTLLRKIPIKQAGKASLKDYMPLKEMGLDKFYIK